MLHHSADPSSWKLLHHSADPSSEFVLCSEGPEEWKLLNSLYFCHFPFVLYCISAISHLYCISAMFVHFQMTFPVFWLFFRHFSLYFRQFGAFLAITITVKHVFWLNCRHFLACPFHGIIASPCIVQFWVEFEQIDVKNNLNLYCKCEKNVILTWHFVARKKAFKLFGPVAKVLWCGTTERERWWRTELVAKNWTNDLNWHATISMTPAPV